MPRKIKDVNSKQPASDPVDNNDKATENAKSSKSFATLGDAFREMSSAMRDLGVVQETNAAAMHSTLLVDPDTGRLTGVSAGNAAHREAAERGPADIVAPSYDSLTGILGEEAERAELTKQLAIEPERRILTPRPMRPDLSSEERLSAMLMEAQWNAKTSEQARDHLGYRLESTLHSLAIVRVEVDSSHGLTVAEFMFDFAVRLFWAGSYGEFLGLNDMSLMSRIARRLLLDVRDIEYTNRIALKIKLTKELCRVMESDPNAWIKLVGTHATDTPYQRAHEEF